MLKKPVILIIMDGYGLSKEINGNSIVAAKTPTLDKIFQNYPNTVLKCSGGDVGLPDGQMGNSEVGHTNIGAGRIVYQELTKISKEIENGEFFKNQALISAIDNCKNCDSKLHIIGLLSDGGVHSHTEHLFALLELAKNKNFDRVFVHCFIDGRDTPPQSSIKYIDELEKKICNLKVGKIATISGRYYAMDRDNRWDRIKIAYDAIAKNIGQEFSDPQSGVQKSYDQNITDEFMVPCIINKAPIVENDSIIFFNFRPDRAREITRVFIDPKFDEFEREYIPVHFTCFTQYDAEFERVQIAFKPQELKNTFGEYISRLGLTQLRIAETEKYAHVTFFFNCGVEQPYKNEDRILVPSPKVSTYDVKPEMSAFEVTDQVIKAIRTQKYDFILLNYANCDMVGHTGDFEAAKRATEVVDECIEKVIHEISNYHGTALVTSDHGNAECMLQDGHKMTAHTTNLVPFAIVGEGFNQGISPGSLCDIAPTILKIMNIDKPTGMLGESMI